MHVRHVRVRVAQPFMAMQMRVGYTCRIVRSVGVLVVFIVNMRVGMCHRLVDVLMPVIFGDVKIDAQSHESPCQEQLERDRLMQQSNSRNRPEERCG